MVADSVFEKSGKPVKAVTLTLVKWWNFKPLVVSSDR